MEKKKALYLSGCVGKQKGIGINSIWRIDGKHFFMPKSFCTFKFLKAQPHTFAFAFVHFRYKTLAGNKTIITSLKNTDWKIDERNIT
jgi:hypothetical protein